VSTEYLIDDNRFIHVIYDDEMLENGIHIVKETNDDVVNQFVHTKEVLKIKINKTYKNNHKINKLYKKNNHKQQYTQRIQKTALFQAKFQYRFEDESIKSENELKENIKNVPPQQNANALPMKIINENIPIIK
ncbi:44152_t:CDS:1, partial [Gigaspora margarita]